MSSLTVERFDFDKHNYIIDHDAGLIRADGSDFEITLKSLHELEQKTPTRSKVLRVAVHLTDAVSQNFHKFSSVSQRVWGRVNAKQKIARLKEALTHAQTTAEQRESTELNQAFSTIKAKAPSEEELADLRLRLDCASDTLQKSALFQQARAYYVDAVSKKLAKNAFLHPDEHIDSVLELDPSLDFLSKFQENGPSDAAINRVVAKVASKNTFFSHIYSCVYKLFIKPPTQRLFFVTVLLFECGTKHFGDTISNHSSVKETWDTLSKKIPQEIPFCDLLSDFIAEVAELTLHDKKYKFLLEEALQYLLRANQVAFLDRIILLNLDKQLLEPIVVALEKMYGPTHKDTEMGKLMERYRQISAVIPSKPPLTKREAFLLARFLERNVSGDTSAYYNKEKHELPRSVQKKEQTKDHAILLTRKEDLYAYPEGTWKRSGPVFFIPAERDKKASLACRTVNHIQIKHPDGTTSYTTEEIGREVLTEALIHKNLTGLRGIWPQLMMHAYTKTITIQTDTASKEIEVPRISVISPLGSSLMQFCETFMPECFPFIIHRSTDLAFGLKSLHERKEVHLDIKADNALYGKDMDGKDIGGWIDFGHHTTIQELREHPKALKGTYGTRIFTAPELIGKESFSGDVTKLDVWAFGCMLYWTFLGKKPSWQSEILEKIPHEKDTIADEQVIAMHALIKKEIEPEYEKLHKSTNRSWNEELQYVIFGALRFCPEYRWDMRKISEHLEKLCQTIPPDMRKNQKLPPYFPPDQIIPIPTDMFQKEPPQ